MEPSKSSRKANQLRKWLSCLHPQLRGNYRVICKCLHKALWEQECRGGLVKEWWCRGMTSCYIEKQRACDWRPSFKPCSARFQRRLRACEGCTSRLDSDLLSSSLPWQGSLREALQDQFRHYSSTLVSPLSMGCCSSHWPECLLYVGIVMAASNWCRAGSNESLLWRFFSVVDKSQLGTV